MRILSVDGGGYLGLATASFLHAIEQRFGARVHGRFDLFCGTSTGAIIALALASGKTGEEVRSLYRRLGPMVFGRPPLPERLVPVLRKLRAIVTSLHGSRHLQTALADAFGELTLGDLHAREKKVLVTAFCLTSGRPFIFKTDHSPELKLHDQYLLRDVALASSAAPSFLPLVELCDPRTGARERFCDGGLVSNSPALLGFAEAVSHMHEDPAEISILSLGTPRTDLAERTSALPRSKRKLSRGLLGWDFGQRIISIALDGGVMISDTALERIATASGSNYVRVSLSQPKGLGLDIATPAATETLEQLGVDCARDREVVNKLGVFFE
jgi:patatin-like phospholipase/acyl hydrolase